jgi:hypothetical protein
MLAGGGGNLNPALRVVCAAFVAPLPAALLLAVFETWRWGGWPHLGEMSAEAAIISYAGAALFILPPLFALWRLGWVSLVSSAGTGAIVATLLALVLITYFAPLTSSADPRYVGNGLAADVEFAAACASFGALTGAVFWLVALGRSKPV